jgi:hypothetical protein
MRLPLRQYGLEIPRCSIHSEGITVPPALPKFGTPYPSLIFEISHTNESWPQKVTNARTKAFARTTSIQVYVGLKVYSKHVKSMWGRRRMLAMGCDWSELLVNLNRSQLSDPYPIDLLAVHSHPSGHASALRYSSGGVSSSPTSDASLINSLEYLLFVPWVRKSWYISYVVIRGRLGAVVGFSCCCRCHCMEPLRAYLHHRCRCCCHSFVSLHLFSVLLQIVPDHIKCSGMESNSNFNMSY